MNSPEGQEMPVRTYQLDEASFELPVMLKDKTVHVFALNDEGPNEFNVVISRGDSGSDETLDEFAERLSAELKKALPKFQLKRRQECQVSGAEAVELFYAWSNNGVPMQQRQTITLVEGPDGKQAQALMIAATCLNGFTEKWHQTYDQLVGSVKLRKPWLSPSAPEDVASSAQATALVTEPAAKADAARCWFALSRDGTLHLFDSVEAMIERTNALEVEDGQWKFYDHDGHPLEVSWQQPNRRGLLRTAGGRYELKRAAVGSALGPLQNRIATVERVLGPMQSIAAVREHLDQMTRKSHHA